MPEEKDLMSQVGESFGIQDAPQQQEGGDEGGADDQQQPQEGEQQAPQQPQQPQERDDQPAERMQRGRDQKDDQLFDQKPKRGPRGELLDKEGKVVASTRREKQLAYNLNRAQYAANHANRTNRQLVATLQQYKGLDDQIKASKLDMRQVKEALDLRAMAERDPVLAVRDIVARVLATGITMDQLFGPDAVPGINAQVITNELDRRLGPLEQQQKQAAQQQQINERAQEQMEQYVHNHPYADVHGVEISNLVSQHGMSPEKAYYELRSWVERRGFDFTSPLEPQIRAAMQRSGGKPKSTPGGMRGAQPNGQFTTQRTGNSRADFRSNTPWKDIAAAVFTELNSK